MVKHKGFSELIMPSKAASTWPNGSCPWWLKVGGKAKRRRSLPEKLLVRVDEILLEHSLCELTSRQLRQMLCKSHGIDEGTFKLQHKDAVMKHVDRRTLETMSSVSLEERIEPWPMVHKEMDILKGCSALVKLPSPALLLITLTNNLTLCQTKEWVVYLFRGCLCKFKKPKRRNPEFCILDFAWTLLYKEVHNAFCVLQAVVKHHDHQFSKYVQLTPVQWHQVGVISLQDFEAPIADVDQLLVTAHRFLMLKENELGFTKSGLRLAPPKIEHVLRVAFDLCIALASLYKVDIIIGDLVRKEAASLLEGVPDHPLTLSTALEEVRGCKDLIRQQMQTWDTIMRDWREFWKPPHGILVD